MRLAFGGVWDGACLIRIVQGQNPTQYPWAQLPRDDRFFHWKARLAVLGGAIGCKISS